MASDPDSLQWSSRLAVTPRLQTPKLPGDKIVLPQSALEQLLAAAPVVEVPLENSRAYAARFDPFNPYAVAAEARARAQDTSEQQQLPHPLTFRIVNPKNGRIVHAGIREFSAREAEVGLSDFLRNALGLEDNDSTQGHGHNGRGGGIERIETGDVVESLDTGGPEKKGSPVVTVHAKQLPKGTYVRLRPLEAGYDPDDWKALLERHLRDNFTTLTTGELLTVIESRHETFRLLVDKVLPEGDGICIVDTDLEVDIEPLNEEQARESRRRQLERTSRPAGIEADSSAGGPINLEDEMTGQVRRGEYVDYELRDWDPTRGIDILLDVVDDVDDAGIDLFVNPFSSRQRARPRDAEHVFGDFSTKFPKRIRVQPTNVELVDAEALYISVHAFSIPDAAQNETEGKRLLSRYNLRAVPPVSFDEPESHQTPIAHDPENVQCKNCQQWVPKRTLFLHENFCFRNNIFCQKCGNVFQKTSAEWRSHWHCPHDSACGNHEASKIKHDIVSHRSYTCPSCQFLATNLPALAHHRTSTCPGKLILCQFCHLAVPQQGDSDPDPSDPEVLLSGLTPHELIDGGRTTECHLCKKIVRLRDMKTHLRHHDLERLAQPAPRICINPNCGRPLDGGRSGHKPSNDSLRLCSICYGPLYADVHDPEGKALQRRIERRYLTQMMTGCGKSWCQNLYCKTGRQTSVPAPPPTPMTTRDILALTKPLLDAVDVRSGANTAPIYFCSDELSQRRRTLADLIAAEGIYSIEWCVVAVDGAAGELDQARDWLKNWAPERGEVARS